MIKYACGCVRNRVVCAEATRLWDQVANAHNRLARAQRQLGRPGQRVEAQDAYNRALAKYEGHFALPILAPDDEQAVLPMEEG